MLSITREQAPSPRSIVDMSSRRRIAAASLALALATSVLMGSPAQAAPQSLFGTTVDVIAQPSGDSLLGSTAYVTDGAGLLAVSVASPLPETLTATLVVGATPIGSCSIPAGLTICDILFTTLPVGSNAVTVRFESDGMTQNYTGTLVGVTDTVPTFRIEWQDASGAWVDGSGAGLTLLGGTALRCVVTNNSNASLEFDTVGWTINFDPSGSSGGSISDTLAAGEVGTYPLWSGAASSVIDASCSGGVILRDGTTTGNGTGGSVIPMSGTITADRVPAPGTTVTITADSLVPDLVASYGVLLDGVPVAGSPVAAPAPSYDFSIPVSIPASIAPGDHVLTVVTVFNSRTIALAAFPFQVAAPELAATGAELDRQSAAWFGFAGLLVLAVGGALLLASRRRYTA